MVLQHWNFIFGHHSLEQCTASVCTESKCLFSQPCVMMSYLLVPLSLLLALSLIIAAAFISPSKPDNFSTKWRNFNRFFLFLCLMSAFIHWVFFVSSIFIIEAVPKVTSIYYAVVSFIFLAFAVKTNKCQHQIESFLQLLFNFGLLGFHAVLISIHIAVIAKFGPNIHGAFMFIICLILHGMVFTFLFGCFVAQAYAAIHNKGFSINQKESYITDGSDLGCAEKDLNFYTYLSIGWITPLMDRGWYGCINTVNDMYHLPESIDIPKFSEILEKELQSESACTSKSVKCDDEKRRTYDSNDDDSPDTGTFENANQVLINSRKQPSKAETDGIRNHSLFRVFFKVYGLMILPLLLLRVVADACYLASPLLLNLFITYLSDEDGDFSYGLMVGVGMISLVLVGVVLDQANFNERWKCAFRVRGSFMITIYKKILQVNQCERSKFSSAEIANFMSRDASNICSIPLHLHQFVAMPLNILVVLLVIYWQVGISFLAGMVLCILCLPFNQWLSGRIMNYDQQYYNYRDKRMKVITEFLNGIRTVKLAALESFFTKKVTEIRKVEIVYLTKRKYLDAFCVYMWAALPVLLCLFIFSSYSALGHEVTAAAVFTVLCYINLLMAPLNSFPWYMNYMIEASVSMKRLNNFYAMEAFEMKNYYSLNDQLQSTANRVEFEAPGCSEKRVGPSDGDENIRLTLDVQNATFSHAQNTERIIPVTSAVLQACLKCLCMAYTNDDVEPTPNVQAFQQLQNLHLSVGHGQFVGVFGKVGSGKTSLLSSIIGEMNKLGGFITTSEWSNGFGYVPQEAWLQTGTIRDNILLGSLFNGRLYERVLRACALVDDMKSLPDKDLTLVGERGITLSGGQKVRVNLARALYKDFNLYLLDDPMSAVDAHVAAHIYKHCIRGFLRDKTVILCTHHLQYLKEAYTVVCLDDGKISAMGEPSEVLSNYKTHVLNEESSENNSDEKNCELESKELFIKDRDNQDYQVIDLSSEKQQRIGDVDWKLYLTYFKACGSALCALTFVCLVLMQCSKNVSDWWLTYWTKNSNRKEHSPSNLNNSFSGCSSLRNYGTSPLATATNSSFGHSDLLGQHLEFRELCRFLSSNFVAEENAIGNQEHDYRYYLLIYSLLAFLNSVFSSCRAFSFAYANIRASLKMHKKLLDSVLKFKSSVFSITPVGKIINRFASDISILDDDLPFDFNNVLSQTFSTLGLLIVILITVPYIIPFILVMLVAFYRLQVYYRRTSRELRRIATANMSPVYQHFNETLYGVSVIKAMRLSELFTKENEKRVIQANRARYNERAVQRWFAIRVQLVSAIILMLAVCFGLLQKQFAPGAIQSGLMGLCLTYCLAIRSTLTQLLATFAESEKNIISVERINEYLDCQNFEKLSGYKQVPQPWPSDGEVQFCNVTLRYSDDDQSILAALQNLTLKVEGGQKVGICGRTGAGKTSLFSALFRLQEICTGNIFIDGVDIAAVPVRFLRTRLSIIPQDPFLFTGSVRENLDQSEVDSERTDDELWQALERANMKEAVERLGGLEADVGENGQFFSAGQKQLMCLARALLLDTTILCLDEATANVDIETDYKIQKTIREEFKDQTVITIAHRINTILHCDKVVVLRDGKLLEEGSPHELVSQGDSAFAQLLAQSASDND